MGDQEIVDRLEEVWRSLDELCSGLSEAEWKTPTDLPAWSVQDNVSHVIDIEQLMMGRPSPDHTPADLSYATNPLAHRNEVGVDYRRSWPGEKVLAEFRETVAERLQMLRSWTPDDFTKETVTPLGPGKARDMLGIRLVDCWVHEQDIRRALGRPGHLDGPAATLAYQRLVASFPYVVGKKVAPPDGTVVRLEVAGADPITVTVEMRDGRGYEAGPDAAPTATIQMDLATYVAVVNGRWDAGRALSSGGVRVEGDESLGVSVLEQMNIMF